MMYYLLMSGTSAGMPFFSISDIDYLGLLSFFSEWIWQWFVNFISVLNNQPLVLLIFPNHIYVFYFISFHFFY